ncbi:MAG: radical SAM protein [candidate division Zixibacteria bacterium]|nr:radical SAM protein [candidate division Zixibacteria bacterium]
MKYQLHREVGMRRDVDRSIIYVKNPIDSELSDFLQTISTELAVFLGLMDGSMELDDILKIWSELFFGIEPDRRIGKLLQDMLNSKLGPDIMVYEILNKIDSRTPVREDLPDISALIVSKEIEDIKDPRLRIPLQMLFLPTLKCTQKCYYCYSSESYSDNILALDFERVIEIMEEAKNIGMHAIDFSGGEPVSYKYFFPLLEKLFDLGLEVNLPTKYPLSREEVRMLKDIGLKTIQISIDALSPKILDKVIGIKGYGEKILKTLDYLEESGIGVRTNTVITSYTLPEMEYLMRFLATKENIYRITQSPYSYSRFKHEDNFPISTDEYDTVLGISKEILKMRPDISFNPGDVFKPYEEVSVAEREVDWASRSFCSGGRQSFALLPDGKVAMCEELYYQPQYIMGDLKKQSIMEMWNSPEAKSISYPPKELFPDGPCRDCESLAACHYFPGRCVRESIKFFGEGKHYYPDPRCPKAPIEVV